MMEFFKIEKSNIDILYDLNLQLAIDENQKDLFTASRKCYADSFLSSVPISFGFLSYIGNKAVGFYIYCFKFASYLGSRVLYIEDLYLTKQYRSPENKEALIKHAIKQSRNDNCCRVEMRVLKTFNFGYNIINDCGFNQIMKWDVYRFDHDH